jgi:hypothetical protein
MTKYEVEKKSIERIEQGDIYKEIEHIENVEIIDSDIEISRIIFPYVVVLSQDCDLQQASAYFRSDGQPKDQDKKILSVIVAPLYNEELFLAGEHLADETINYKMQIIPKEKKKGELTSQYRNLINNEIPRYHYLSFQDGSTLPNMVIDFKHFFTVNTTYLEKNRSSNFVAKIKPLYRESVTLRFANFLSRIGLP